MRLAPSTLPFLRRLARTSELEEALSGARSRRHRAARCSLRCNIVARRVALAVADPEVVATVVARAVVLVAAIFVKQRIHVANIGGRGA